MTLNELVAEMNKRVYKCNVNEISLALARPNKNVRPQKLTRFERFLLEEMRTVHLTVFEIVAIVAGFGQVELVNPREMVDLKEAIIKYLDYVKPGPKRVLNVRMPPPIVIEGFQTALNVITGGSVSFVEREETIKEDLSNRKLMELFNSLIVDSTGVWDDNF